MHEFDAPRPAPAPPIATEKVVVDRKVFFLDLKENHRGRVLKITEDVGGRRNTIMLPAEAFRDFVAALNQFLSALSKGWEYGVEIRNKTWLQPDYFEMLKSHGVAHVYNNWTRMPSVAEQLAIAGSETADFTVSRFLLKPGRTYEASVEQFSPYREIKERVEEARTAAQKILEGSSVKKKRGYLYVNNRLEGCAPLTIGGC